MLNIQNSRGSKAVGRGAAKTAMVIVTSKKLSQDCSQTIKVRLSLSEIIQPFPRR